MPPLADLKVNVKAPSRGLFTRWPSEDSELEQGRAATAAQNVRFEDGVVCNAPGRSRIAADSSLDSPANLIFESNTVGNAASNNSLFVGTEHRLFLAQRSFRSADGYRLALTNVASNLNVFADSAARWQADNFFDKVVFNQATIAPQYWDGSGLLKPLPGLPLGQLYNGVTVFLGRIIFWNDTTIKWGAQNDYATFIPVASTINSVVVTVSGGFTQPAVSATVTVPVVALDGPLTQQQYLQLRNGDNLSTYSVTANYPRNTTSIVLKLEAITGYHAAATVFPDAQQLFTIDANSAGEVLNVGGQISGPIFQVVPLGDTAFVLKNRSIQSIQYVGVNSGVFFIRPEISDEGMIARNAFVRIGSNAGQNGGGRIVFLGLKELYEYRGGPQLTPVCQQFTRQLFAELDRGRLDEIVLSHREDRSEVWIIYPSTDGQFKILVWNYFENTATLDNYEAESGGICALGMAFWDTDPTWGSATGTWAQQTVSWNQFSSTGVKRLMLMGNRGDIAGLDTWEGLNSFLTWDEEGSTAWKDFENPSTQTRTVPRLYVHGLEYSNDGSSYLSQFESFDFDFGNSEIFKYAHTVRFSIQLTASLPLPKRLFVQLGGRANLDSGIVWSAPTWIDVSGDGQLKTQVNPRASGRFIRLRVYSNDADVKWRISSFTIFARPGGRS